MIVNVRKGTKFIVVQPYSKGATFSPAVRTLCYYLFAVASYAILFSFWQTEPVPSNVHLAAILLAATCFIPYFIWQARGGKDLPMFEIICLSYVVQFSMPVYTQPNYIVIFSRPFLIGWDRLFTTLLFTEAGIIALLLGYYMAHNSPFIHRLPKFDLQLAPERRYSYLGIALSGGLIVLWLTYTGLVRIQALNSIMGLLGGQLYVAVVILAYQVYGQPQSSFLGRNILWAVVICTFLIGLISGLLENAFVILVLVLLVRWHTIRQIPWSLLLVGTLLFFILNSAKSQYRVQVWYGDTTYNTSDKLGVWMNLFTESWNTYLFDPLNDREGQIQKTLARFDLIHKFAYVHTLTPTVIPYYNGQSYKYFFVAWVPRFLWPSKPVASDITSRMDVEYALKTEGSSTTMAIGLLPEAYANFGLMGILLILAIQGGILGIFDSVLNGPESEGGRGIYITLMVYFLNGIGSSAALVFGALLQQTIAHSLLLYPFTQSTHTKPSRPLTITQKHGSTNLPKQPSFRRGF